MNPATHPTIGVFDSGFGGLTVLRALLPLIPDANPRRPSNQQPKTDT
jgi:glutamate racemase